MLAAFMSAMMLYMCAQWLQGLHPCCIQDAKPALPTAMCLLSVQLAVQADCTVVGLSPVSTLLYLFALAHTAVYSLVRMCNRQDIGSCKWCDAWRNNHINDDNACWLMMS